MNSNELRKRFFDYFTTRGHTQVVSSSLIPAEDPTLLFANAGMNQFKDLFLGKEKRSYKRAVSIQKCIRAGGKHNDLDQVGFTSRHLTFFEMMGNFSFGDYFKHDAIKFAWEFLTTEVGLPAEKLYASVFEKDDESYAIWKEVIGLPVEHIVRLGAADNFWQMGETGPCGPCTEIYIDRGATIGCGESSCAPGCSCDRFLEIWNNVFMQFDRQLDGSAGYTDVALAQTGVDTGMGLERLCAVVQGVDSVFNTDLFAPLLGAIERETGIVYRTATADIRAAFHVVADHLRSSAGAIADGGMPSNEGRGYVIRKIIRRATLFAQKLNCPDLLVRLIPTHVGTMGAWYPELKQQESLITEVIRVEVNKFAHNVVAGREMVLEYLRASREKTLSGAQLFKLYDTYGFPVELSELIAHEQGYRVDRVGFEREMEKQREQSKRQVATGITCHTNVQTVFTGYTEYETSSQIAQIIVDNLSQEQVSEGTTCWIIPHKTPFYVECGGQISDTGMLVINGQEAPILGLVKIDKAIAFACIAPTDMRVGDRVMQRVNRAVREATMRNHTATHLLQAALMSVLGPQVKQSGSLVAPDYLRFDFTYPHTVTLEEVARIEQAVNQVILANIKTEIAETTYQEAISRGVIAFFGEKYNPESVRVVAVPGVSAELCGGTHVRATGDIGLFKITELTALSAGNRRIVAVTGMGALTLFQESYQLTQELGRSFKVQRAQIVSAIARQADQLKETQQQLKKIKKQLMQAQVPVLVAQASEVGGIPYRLVTIAEGSAEELKELVTLLLTAQAGCYVAVTRVEGKLLYYGALSANYAQCVDVKQLGVTLKTAGYPGGASAQSVQGGSTVGSAEQLDALVRDWLVRATS